MSKIHLRGKKKTKLWQLSFAFLLLTLQCPYVHLHWELIHQYDSVQTLLAICKLHACFYVVGESLLTAAQIRPSVFK